MAHFGGTADGRSASEILIAARDLQARHAPRVLGAALRRLPGTWACLTGGRGTPEGRRLPAG